MGMCLSRELQITNTKLETERQERRGKQWRKVIESHEKRRDELLDKQTYLHTQQYMVTDRHASHQETMVIDREESRELMSRLWANNITSHPQQHTAHTPYLSAFLCCIVGVEGQSRAAMGFERRSAWATH